MRNRLSIMEAAAKELLPRETYEALSDAALALDQDETPDRHYAIMSRDHGAIGCMSDPDPEDVAHALIENPGCTIESVHKSRCPSCLED